MAKPLAKARARSQFFQPLIKVRLVFCDTSRPQAIHQYALAVVIAGRFIDVLDLNDVLAACRFHRITQLSIIPFAHVGDAVTDRQKYSAPGIRIENAAELTPSLPRR